MPEVLIITGPCGVGKSTLAKAWAKSKEGAIIECDFLTEWIYNTQFKSFEPEEEKFVAKLTLVMASEYLKANMSLAIENVWRPASFKYLVTAFNKLGYHQIKCIRLKCAIKENHRRDEERVPEDQMKERVDIVNKEQDGYDFPSYVRLIDTTNISVEETLELLEQLRPVS